MDDDKRGGSEKFGTNGSVVSEKIVVSWDILIDSEIRTAFVDLNYKCYHTLKAALISLFL